MTTTAASPLWLVVVVTAAGLLVGVLLARPLATLEYRLDDEELRPTRELPRLPRGAGDREMLGPLPLEPRPRPAPPWVVVVAVPVVWAVLTWRLGGVAQGALLPAFLLLGAVGVALAWVDADVHRLPQGLTLPLVPGLLALLVVASAVSGDWGALLRAVLVGVGGGAAYLLLSLLSLLVPGLPFGLGDVTLGAILSAALGWLGVATAVAGAYLAFLVAGVVLLVLLLARRVRRHTSVAFGPYLVAGALLAPLLTVRPLGG